MAGLTNISLQIGPQAPSNLDPKDFHAIDDLYRALNSLANQINAGSIVLQSPNLHYWKATIGNTGTLTWTDVGLVRP